jgi:DNA-binding FrmR family transcriptional regulator
MTVDNKKKSLVNIRKSIGILEKVISMVENGEYCIDIVQQNLASIGLIKSANNTILECHLRTCFKDAILSKDETRQESMIKELININNVKIK